MTSDFENVNHLVLNFYPDGYSLAVKLNEFPVFTSETILETAKIPYEETSLLDYFENEELPPLLVDMIDSSPKLSKYKIWHNGCLVLEVRDKMNPIPKSSKIEDNDIHNLAESTEKDNSVTDIDSNSNQINSIWPSNLSEYGDKTDHNYYLMPTQKSKKSDFFILLKPTNLSMLHDVTTLTDSSFWTAEDILQLESQIVLHNSPPLSLEPTVTSKQMPDSKQDSHDKYSIIAGKQGPQKLRSIYSSLVTSTGLSQNNNNHQVQSTNRTPPPELILQQFLATKRAKRTSFSIGQAPKFQRFKKHFR